MVYSLSLAFIYELQSELQKVHKNISRKKAAESVLSKILNHTWTFTETAQVDRQL